MGSMIAFFLVFGKFLVFFFFFGGRGGARRERRGAAFGWWAFLLWAKDYILG